MDPSGYFSGSTLVAAWTKVNHSHRYSVAVLRCDDDSNCDQVFHKLVQDNNQSTQSLTEASPEFDDCTIYKLKVGCE